MYRIRRNGFHYFQYIPAYYFVQHTFNVSLPQFKSISGISENFSTFLPIFSRTTYHLQLVSYLYLTLLHTILSNILKSPIFSLIPLFLTLTKYYFLINLTYIWPMPSNLLMKIIVQCTFLIRKEMLIKIRCINYQKSCSMKKSHLWALY